MKKTILAALAVLGISLASGALAPAANAANRYLFPPTPNAGSNSSTQRRGPLSAADSPMEAVMVGTFLIILAALVIAVLGCACVGPIDVGRADGPTRQRRT